MDTEPTSDDQQKPVHSRSDLPGTARRALAEAEVRRQAAKANEPPREIGGRKGPDPARYGDWEVKGIATDF